MYARLLWVMELFHTRTRWFKPSLARTDGSVAQTMMDALVCIMKWRELILSPKGWKNFITSKFSPSSQNHTIFKVTLIITHFQPHTKHIEQFTQDTNYPPGRPLYQMHPPAHRKQTKGPWSVPPSNPPHSRDQTWQSPLCLKQ